MDDGAAQGVRGRDRRLRKLYMDEKLKAELVAEALEESSEVISSAGGGLVGAKIGCRIKDSISGL